MEIEGKRFLVAGGGALGSAIAEALSGAGARVLVTSRRPAEADDAIAMEITDPRSREAALSSAESRLGGLDGLIVATGAVAFGPVGEIDADLEERLMNVDAVGPMRLISAAVDRLEQGGTVVAITAVVAEFPTAGVAAYSAAKAALSAYLAALRRERRRRLASVIDVRPGHMETGFSGRALAGDPPKMPKPEDADELVAAIVDAIANDRRELAYDPIQRTLKAR